MCCALPWLEAMPWRVWLSWAGKMPAPMSRLQKKLRLPVILQAGPGCRKHTPVPILGKMFRHLAEQARVPVVCHIDHALTLDECRDGIDHGFTSVMIDGSMLALDENIALTARVVNWPNPLPSRSKAKSVSSATLAALPQPTLLLWKLPRLSGKPALMPWQSPLAICICKLTSRPKSTGSPSRH